MCMKYYGENHLYYQANFSMTFQHYFSKWVWEATKDPPLD